MNDLVVSRLISKFQFSEKKKKRAKKTEEHNNNNNNLAEYIYFIVFVVEKYTWILICSFLFFVHFFLHTLLNKM